MIIFRRGIIENISKIEVVLGGILIEISLLMEVIKRNRIDRSQGKRALSRIKFLKYGGSFLLSPLFGNIATMGE